MKWKIGVDEVGRGPIAGPLVVVACAVRDGVDPLLLYPKQQLKDSKKLSKKARESIYEAVHSDMWKNDIMYGLGEVSSEEIDTHGLANAIKRAVSIALSHVALHIGDDEYSLTLDGSLYAGDEYKEQRTVIKGDEKYIEISLASVIAKVYRDGLMKRYGDVYKGYGFERHVGYGTQAHYDALQTLGVTPLHRRSFLKKVL